MDFRVLVWKRVCKITFFGLKSGQDLKNPAAHPHQEFSEVTPPLSPGATTIFLSISSDQFNDQWTRGDELKNLLSEISISILAIWF